MGPPRLILVEYNLVCLVQFSRLVEVVLCQIDIILFLNISVQLDGAVTLHTGTSRNQLTNQNVLLQTNQLIYLSVDGSLGQNLGCLLEGCSG